METIRIAMMVATPLSFLGLCAAFGYYSYARRLRHDEAQLKALPDDARAKIVDERLTRYGIDGGKFTKAVRARLIEDEMDRRYRLARMKAIIFATAFICCFAFATFAYVFGVYLGNRKQGDEKSQGASPESSQSDSGAATKPIPALVPQAVDAGTLKVYMQLDPRHTSVQCTKPRTDRDGQQDLLDIRDCAEYDILRPRLRQIAFGNDGEVSVRDRMKFEDKYFKSMFRPSIDALITVQKYRGSKGQEINGLVEASKIGDDYYQWKKSIITRDLLPNKTEWERLAAERPESWMALRKFVIEWIGLPDPCFRVSFENTSGDPITVSRVSYKAVDKRDSRGAMVPGGDDLPTYQLLLKPGEYTESLHPAIILPPKTAKEVGLLIRLEKPQPGSLYSIQLSFQSADSKYHVQLPEFAVRFWRDKFE